MVDSRAPVNTPVARRRRRWLTAIGLALVVVVTAAFGLVRARFSGAELGDNIASILNKRMRGRIEIGSVEWSSASLQRVLTGGWVPVTIRDVRVWDDCALSAAITGSEGEELRTGDPNEDCTPDDRPDLDPTSRRKPRKLLLRTDLVTAEIDIHAVMFGHHDFVFRNLWVHGGEALLEQTREPYPLHAYDRTIVSLVTAFYPRQAPGFRAGITAETPPPIFDLRDIHVAGLNLTLHMSPYTLAQPTSVGYGFTARLEGVDVDAGSEPANSSYLYMDPTDPLVAKFYVRLAVAARRGTVRILDEGPRAAFRLPARGAIGGLGAEIYPPAGRRARYQLSLADIRLDRLAQLPAQWARRDFVANTLELDLRARTLPCPTAAAPTHDPDAGAGADLHLAGELFSYWDRPYDGAWNLKLDARNLGPTVRSCIHPMIGGDRLDGTISLTGPFVAQPAVGLDLTGVDVDVPLGKAQEPLRLTLAELHGKIDLVNDEGYIEKTKALVRGGKEPGEVDLSATFGLKPLYSNAQVEIVKAIDVGRFLPRSVGPLGRFLQGRLRAIGDVDEGFELREFDLALGATPSEKALRVYHGRLFTKDKFGSIRIENVFADAGKSHAELNGLVDVDRNDMNLRIDGTFPDLDVWLSRFGLPALVKSAGGGVIVIQGPLTRPTVNVDTTLAGVPCIDQLKLENLVYRGDTIDIQKLSSPGLGGQLTGKGLIRLGGSAPVIERLQLTGSRLDASRLCGLKGVKGTIDELDVDLHGEINPRRSPLDYLGLGQVYARADHLSVLDDRYSAISACINRRDDSRCRARPASADAEDRAECEDGKRAAAAGGNGFCVVASATRDAGGTLDATIAQLPAARVTPRAVTPTRLGGAVSLADLPLALIDQLRGVPAARTVGGLASLTLHLQGLPGAPQATGAVQLLRAWLANGFLGDAQLAVKPTTIDGVAGVQFTGTALAGRLAITGSLGTAAPYPLELAVSGRRIEVDPYLDLQALLSLPDPVQAWVSGTVTLRTQLAPARPVEPEVWIELTELAAQLDYRTSDGRVTPLVLRVKDQDPQHRAALSVRATPSSFELACRAPGKPGGRIDCPAILETPAGDIAIQGHATRSSVQVTAEGPLDLGKLRVLLDRRFDYVAGRVRFAASLTGQFDHPAYTAEIDLDPDQVWTRNEAERDARREAAATHRPHREAPILPDEKPVVLRPIGSDTVLTAPRGLIKLANGSIGFTDVLVQVKDDRHVDEQGDLHIAGNIALNGLTPVGWSMLLSGRLAGKMLQITLPNLVAQADGLIDIDDQLRLIGNGAQPAIKGTLLFDKQNPLSLIPRGVRRELTFRDGKIELDTSDDQRTYTVAIADVDGTIDDGKLTNISGSLKIQNNELTGAAFRLSADSIPFRIPQTLDLVLSASDVRVTLDDRNAPWRVKGTLRVIDGAYLRNFEITDRIQAIGVNVAPTRPFWEEYPALGSAELDLKLDVGLFAVKSNIATIEFQGDNLHIGGSPRDPRLNGQIRVTHGDFHIPGARAAFNRTTGSVDFAENQPASNPELHVTSEADYRDLSGQDHVITATISGTLQQLSWDLRTSTGYNKSQTLSLLVLGRSPDQLRRSLGDQSIGTDPTRIDPTTNPSQGIADQIVKDLAGDWVSDLLGSSLTKLTGLDVLRIEIGFGSIGLHAEKKVLENLKALGDAEQTIRGQTIKVRAELRTPFVVSLGYLNQNYYDPAEQDIVDYDVKLVYRYRLFIP
jgi:hypothetical protein